MLWWPGGSRECPLLMFFQPLLKKPHQERQKSASWCCRLALNEFVAHISGPETPQHTSYLACIYFIFALSLLDRDLNLNFYSSYSKRSLKTSINTSSVRLMMHSFYQVIVHWLIMNIWEFGKIMKSTYEVLKTDVITCSYHHFPITWPKSHTWITYWQLSHLHDDRAIVSDEVCDMQLKAGKWTLY